MQICLISQTISVERDIVILFCILSNTFVQSFLWQIQSSIQV